MIQAPAHDFDLPFTRTLLEEARARMETYPQRLDLELRTKHLDSSSRSARSYLDLFVRIEPSSPDLVRWGRFVAEAKAALFTFARRPERDRWRLLEAERTLREPPPTDALYLRNWLPGFWLALATRDARSLALLVQVPPTLMPQWEPFDRPLLQALQGLITGDPQSGAMLVRALDAVDPEKVTRTGSDYVLDILAPIFECLVPLADRDEGRFAQGLGKLLELRREHFAKGRGEGEDGEQHLSLEGVGLAAWAKALGFEVAVQSPYLPSALLEVEEPDFEACPDCATPASGSCPACGRAIGDDSLEFDLGGWLALDRDGCHSCGHRFPVLARTCPVCLTLRGREAE